MSDIYRDLQTDRFARNALAGLARPAATTVGSASVRVSRVIVPGDVGLKHDSPLLVFLAASLLATSHLEAQDGFGFTGVLGWETVSGGASQVLDQGITGEFDVYYHFGHVRTGIGVNVVSYDAITDNLPPVAAELAQSVSRVTLNLLLGYKFITDGPLRPYVEGRIGYVRLRPEWNYWTTPGEPGENVEDREKGVQYGLRGGLEIPFARAWSADISALWTGFSITEVEGNSAGLENFDSGSTIGVLAGVSFYP
jgi:opacity protein-like surface antigen